MYIWQLITFVDADNRDKLCIFVTIKCFYVSGLFITVFPLMVSQFINNPYKMVVYEGDVYFVYINRNTISRKG